MKGDDRQITWALNKILGYLWKQIVTNGPYATG